MKKFYIEYTKTDIEVYEVEANNIEEAEQKVLKWHHRNAPNIVDKKYTEKCRNVSGMYEYGNLIERFKNFYQ